MELSCYHLKVLSLASPNGNSVENCSRSSRFPSPIPCWTALCLAGVCGRHLLGMVTCRWPGTYGNYWELANWASILFFMSRRISDNLPRENCCRIIVKGWFPVAFLRRLRGAWKLHQPRRDALLPQIKERQRLANLARNVDIWNSGK